MKNINNKISPASLWQIIVILVFIAGPANYAQDESSRAPVPGDEAKSILESEKNAQITSRQALPSAVVDEEDKPNAILLANLAQNDFPVTIRGLRVILEKYKDEAKDSDLNEEKLSALLLWIDGLAKAHNKLAYAFCKQLSLKADYENECALLRDLRQLKDEFLYLKAQTFIKAKKLKLAIPVLVEITCTEPNSALGQKAYQHLKHSGFSLAPPPAQTVDANQALLDKAAKDKQSPTTKH